MPKSECAADKKTCLNTVACRCLDGLALERFCHDHDGTGRIGVLNPKVGVGRVVRGLEGLGVDICRAY